MNELDKLKEAFRDFRYGLATLIAPDLIYDLEHRLSVFLCNQTGGRLSKTNYTTNVMISAAEDYQQRLCERCEYYIAYEERNKNEDSMGKCLVE